MRIVENEHPKEAAAQALTDALRTNAGKQVLLMVSGGSALELLDSVDTSVLGCHITLTTLDERYSHDEAVSNFAQLEQTHFYTAYTQAGGQTISTRTLDGETLNEMRERHEKNLRTWKEHNPEGVVIATMGIGPDGHTAGIFPGAHEVVFDDDSWIAGYSIPPEVNPHTQRITVTYTFLRNHITTAIVYAVGAEKYRIVKNLESNNSSLQEMPANILKEITDVTIFTSA